MKPSPALYFALRPFGAAILAAAVWTVPAYAQDQRAEPAATPATVSPPPAAAETTPPPEVNATATDTGSLHDQQAVPEAAEAQSDVVQPAAPDTAASADARTATTDAAVAPEVPAAQSAGTANTATTPKGTAEPDATTAEVDAEPEADPVVAAVEATVATFAKSTNTDLHALAEFYTEREFAPLWLADGKLDGSARAVIHRLERADVYGLEPARYATPQLNVGIDGSASPADLANAEISLTSAALQFAIDAHTGVINPALLGELMTAKPVRPNPAKVLKGLSEAPDRVAYLEGFNPPHPAFAALQKLLAELRSKTNEEPLPEIAEGPTLKPGMTDSRVPDLRVRLGLEAVAGDGELVYDDTTVEAVKTFQKSASLEADGAVGPQTRAALNSGADITISDVLVNMERWRWMPREMGSLHVWVNIPEFQLRVVSDGKPFFLTRVIVGTEKNQTPIFSDEIEYVDVNPYWNVPRSIAAKEMMPEIRQDPSYFYRHGLEVIYTGGGREMQIDPRSVDWRMWDGETMPFRFRQPPGGANALGRVKFMFPNKHAVYLHDTPTRNLFSRSVRAFSHGCVRVDKPVEFADALLSREEKLNGKRIKSLIGGGANGSLPLKRHVPVHLTYFTVWVDEAGEIQKRADIYGYDQRMKASMGLGS